MKENKKISIASNLLIERGKSSRLAAISDKLGLSKNTNGLSNDKSQLSFATGLKPEIKFALQEARRLIGKRLEFIINTYPAGKKSAFFKIRYGVDETQIKLMVMKDVFRLLSLDTADIRHFHMIENHDYDGKTVE